MVSSSSSSSDHKRSASRRTQVGMDGPIVPWTVGDAVLKAGGNSAFMTYHVAWTPWALATPVGCVLGAVGWLVVQRGRSSNSTTTTTAARLLLQRMATTGMILGGLGATVGLSRRTMLAVQGEKAQANNNIPWTDEGIQQRVDGLTHNFKVRILDLSTWNGVAASALTLGLLGGGSPVALGLAPGALGVAQLFTLGSAVGGLGGLGCIYATERRRNAALDDNDA